jgi:hypothetical protein
MVKKCVDCTDEAKYKIKDTSEYYCKECAEEHFADLSLLISVEEEAQRLKEYIKEKLEINETLKNESNDNFRED